MLKVYLMRDFDDSLDASMGFWGLAEGKIGVGGLAFVLYLWQGRGALPIKRSRNGF